jgi:hypothetical protein
MRDCDLIRRFELANVCNFAVSFVPGLLQLGYVGNRSGGTIGWLRLGDVGDAGPLLSAVGVFGSVIAVGDAADGLIFHRQLVGFINTGLLFDFRGGEAVTYEVVEAKVNRHKT